MPKTKFVLHQSIHDVLGVVYLDPQLQEHLELDEIGGLFLRVSQDLKRAIGEEISDEEVDDDECYYFPHEYGHPALIGIGKIQGVSTHYSGSGPEDTYLSLMPFDAPPILSDLVHQPHGLRFDREYVEIKPGD